MKAALLRQSGTPLEIAEISVADPGPGEVLVEVAYCGICHSDVSFCDGESGLAPVVLGHEASGVVAEVGQGVSRLAVGDHVMLTPLGPCGRCYWCVRGEFTICAEAQTFAYGVRSDGTSPLSLNGEIVYQGLGVGGWSQLTTLPERNVVKIDADIPLEVACVLGCAVQTGVGAVINSAKVEPGATVLVMGLGGIGMSVVQGARLAGASRIIVSDPVDARREISATFGATDTLDPSQDDVVVRSRELTGGIGVDYAFESAGVASLVETGIEASRVGGTTVMVGAPPLEESVTLSAAVLFMASEKKLIGSLLGSCNSHLEIPRLLALWQQGKLDLESMISHRLELADINTGLDHMRNTNGIRTIVTVA